MALHLVRERSTLRALLVGVLATVLVFATACSTDKSTEPEAPPSQHVIKRLDPALAAKLDAAIADTIKKANIPGAIVGITGPDGTYVHTAGVADKATGAPMKADFYGRIGSVTKTFTVTGILQLVGDGKIGLDDPISKYISGVPEGDKVTIRMLARMQSGLPDYSENDEFIKLFLSDHNHVFTPQQLLDFAWTSPMQFAPGTNWKYTNVNLILLGMVLEKVSGQKIQDYIGEHILKPLGLKHTIFPTNADFPDPHAQGYTVQDESGNETISTNWNPSWGWAAGAMISNLDDLEIWAPALAKGTLLKPEVQAQRMQMVSALHLPAPDGYGLGIFNVGGWIGHNGSLPGYETVVTYLPEKDITMIMLINTDEQYGELEPSTALAQAVTQVLTPDHVYNLAAAAQN
ncbi:serine hydrolase domain-containing protein [Smaragdicoccus niigatensis]|uniref:serine hydrolase domain-containing protein n=1 Tax=Smaragdicoccus niigatensis TaxID=359359 RepID=UPI00068424BE|nr:serine hydrolase domain-containing protein [Smaragdicoccus niigatensis]